MTQGQWIRRVVKPAAIVLSLVPAALLLRDTMSGNLGSNPIETLTHRTGLTAITLLVITLTVTPATRLLRLPALVQVRRVLGLLTFCYATLHFLIYLADQTVFAGQGLSLAAVGEDVAKRPYITVGFATFLLLVPLAVTSTKSWVKRLGGARWLRLHQLVYAAAAGAVFHFLWLVKADTRLPAVYGVLVVALLGYRLAVRRRGARKRTPSAAAAEGSR
jgi:sulfoxide reductase heme-binding subunit YedZ